MTSFHRYPRRSFGVTLTLILGALTMGASTAARAQENQIQLFIAPTDASGQPVTDLKAEQVMMAESGMPGKVVSFERFNLPVRLTIGVDNSADSGQALAHYRTGLTDLVAALPPSVEVAIYATAPQPRALVRATTDREAIARGISLIAPDSSSPRFSEAMVEFAERLEDDFDDKKVPYSPVLIMISTTAAEATSAQFDTIEDAFRTMMMYGTQVHTVMTMTQAGDQTQREMLRDGRQALIAQQIVKATNGQFEALSDARGLNDVLPKWGQELAGIHIKQTNQYRVVLERPAGATGPLNPANLELRLNLANVNAAVSGNGRFAPQ
jgi:hypothetical protein